MSKLDVILAEVNSQIPGSVLRGDEAVLLAMDRISSGSSKLDKLLGGGFARGHIHHIYGDASVGKSTTVALTIATLHKTDPEAQVIVADAEGWWKGDNLKHVQSLGVDLSRLIIIFYPYSETILDVFLKIVNSGAADMAILDSVAALISNEEIDKDLSDKEKIGQHAILVQRFLRKLVHILQPKKVKKEWVTSPCAVVLINQPRTKMSNYVTSEDPTGGRSLKFFSDFTLKISAPKTEYLFYKKDADRLEELKGTAGYYDLVKEVMIGKTVHYEVKKSRIAPTEGQKETARLYTKELVHPSPDGFEGVGFDLTYDLVELAKDCGIIDIAGPWYRIDDFKVQGLNNFIKEVRQEEALRQLLQERVSKL